MNTQQRASVRAHDATRFGNAARALFAACVVSVTASLFAMAASAGSPSFRHARVWDFFRTSDHGGAVYIQTNDARGNKILVFSRDWHGRLTPVPAATVATGGLGGSDNAAVDPLGSQGSLVYDNATQMLFVVNARSNSVTAFDTGANGFQLRRKALVSSDGFIPVSLAVSENLLYVLNAGGSGSVTTFRITDQGGLTKLGTIDLHLPASATQIPFAQIPAPNQVGVDALKRRLIVTHAGGQELLTAALDDDGVPVGPFASTISPGAGPFAFQITRYGTTVVAEAASGSVSSFNPPGDAGYLSVKSATVSGGQAAVCWIVVHENGFLYTSNTGSNTLSQYAYSRTGEIELVNAVAAIATGAPTDLTIAGRGNFLYTVDAAGGAISAFAINPDDGSLTRVDTEGGLPTAGLQGIAARDF
jgi:6-phosphogluconolactonase (cycloisomerase 2 family)